MQHAACALSLPQAMGGKGKDVDYSKSKMGKGQGKQDVHYSQGKMGKGKGKQDVDDSQAKMGGKGKGQDVDYSQAKHYQKPMRPSKRKRSAQWHSGLVFLIMIF